MYNITVEERVSKKTGNAYHVLVVAFKTGYKLELFINNEQFYILSTILTKKGE